jgi:IclR family transcriptional regulator, acetate operon repressor
LSKPRADPETNGESAYSIRAVQRVCDILDLLQSKRGRATLAEVAAVTKLPKSSAFRYLATLEARRYVERDADSGIYQLGLGLLPLRAMQFDLIAERVRPYLEQLRDEYHETLNLAVLEGNTITYLDIVESPRAMRMASRRGDREPIHSTALGKALAAELQEERVRAILAAEGMPAFTERTLTRVDLYLSELQRIREQGFAIDDRENESEGRCVAVAVAGAQPPIAISLSAPISRLPRELLAEVAHRLQAVASTLAYELAGDRQAQVSVSAGDGDRRRQISTSTT